MSTRRAVWTYIFFLTILYTTLDFTRSSENISVRKTATQSSTYLDYVANKAVDGCENQAFTKGCCSHTGEGQKEAWWSVDLGYRSTIITIKIFYRSGYQSRFAGYQLYLSNTTKSPTQGVLCYEDRSSTKADVELVVTHQCPYVARYVTVYNYRNNPKRYSWYANNALLELCEVEVFGCGVGKYGADNCSQDCSVNCYGGNCHPTDGSCFYCVPGLHGSFCSCSGTCTHNKCDDSEYCSECIPGTFGNACEYMCSTHCVNNECSKETGRCFECPQGRFNTTCDTECPIHCDVNNCTREEGFCYDCATGYHGSRCDQECSTNCNDSFCDMDTGHCYECLKGKYNTTCDTNCPIQCAVNNCTREEGFCYECAPGYHGSRCDQECSTNCKDRLCDMDTGHCYAGRYGKNCSLLCGQCDLRTMDSGVCETDCYSGFEGPTCQSTSEDPVGPGPIAAATGGAFVLIIIIAIVLFVIIRRRRVDSTRQRSSANIARKEIAENHIYINSVSAIHKMSDDDQEEPPQNSCNVYVNTEEVVKDGNTSDVVFCNSGDLGVAVSDLKSLVKSKMQNKAKAFKDEYASLPSGALHEHAMGLLSENKPKNRFKATFPYDHSRVKLDTLGDDPNSDYINASYIDSMTQTAEYIATQGPRPGTIDDFWLMIWQQQTGKIVMLTNLVEGAKPKCSKYWPDEEEPLSTAHFNIVLDRKRVYASYVIQDLIVTEKKTMSVRQIHHFHFTTWPDHGTPDLNEIVVFHRRVKQYESFLTGKMVVHCSAGIGRTGTFIALDALVEYGREHGRVDIMGYIRTIRKDRMNMVQTGDQYIAIHHMLIEAFDMPDTLIPKMKYHTTLASLSNGAPTNQTKIRKEYQLTQTLKPPYTQEDFEGALLEENRNKNYTISVLAVDKFRAYLRSQSQDRTDYINAVVVPSYTSRTGYIVTQTPLEQTVVDLLTMIKDHYCETIVIIENEILNWMPAVNEVKTFGEFMLQLDRKSTYIANLDLLEVTLKHRTDDFLHKICVFHLSGWYHQSSDVPEPSSLLNLLELVNGRRRSDESIPTLVMCRDGYSQSGLFCCISNAREQMKMDEEVDVFQITRQLLVRRPEFIINFEQYQCVYRMIKEYLDSTALYMN